MKKNLVKGLIALSIFAGIFGFMVLGLSCFAAEPETTTTVVTTTQATDTQEAVATVEKFIDWAKGLSMADVKGWVAGLFAYLGANFLVILALVIKVMLGKTQQVKDQKFYQELQAKSDEEHKKQMNDLVDTFTKELEQVNQNVIECIKQQNSEKRKLAQDNVSEMKKALDDIKVELDK